MIKKLSHPECITLPVVLAPLRAGFETAFLAWEAGALTRMLKSTTSNVSCYCTS